MKLPKKLTWVEKFPQKSYFVQKKTLFKPYQNWPYLQLPAWFYAYLATNHIQKKKIFEKNDYSSNTSYIRAGNKEPGFCATGNHCAVRHKRNKHLKYKSGNSLRTHSMAVWQTYAPPTFPFITPPLTCMLHNTGTYATNTNTRQKNNRSYEAYGIFNVSPWSL